VRPIQRGKAGKKTEFGAKLKGMSAPHIPNARHPSRKHSAALKKSKKYDI
jgi:hypothetical protein